MINVADIRDPNWSLSTLQQGEILKGDVDIAQSIAIILRTRKGSDPLRPFFGSGIHEYIDQPVTVGAPNIVKEIINALGTWEPRIRVTGVSYVVDGSNVRFVINWERLTDGGGAYSADLISVANFNDLSLAYGDYNFDFNLDFDI